MATNTFLKPGQMFRVIGLNEKLKADFLMRLKYESPMMSESGGWDSTYRHDDWMGTAWHPLEEELPGWVGKTYQEYVDFCEYTGVDHEIIEIIQNGK